METLRGMMKSSSYNDQDEFTVSFWHSYYSYYSLEPWEVWD